MSAFGGVMSGAVAEDIVSCVCLHGWKDDTDPADRRGVGNGKNASWYLRLGTFIS